MLHPKDDLFACGYAEPCSSATVCDVVGIDDLIILGIVVAASVAASQISANEQEGTQNDLLDQQQKNQMKQQQIGFYKNQQDEAAAGIASRHGGHGGMSESRQLQPWADKMAIDQHFDMSREANARQADATRTQGWINGGAQLAGGIASQALRPAAGAGAGMVEAGAGYAGTGADIGARAGGYDLNAGTSSLLGEGPAVSTPQINAADPGGGFQLQAADYQTLGGAQSYSAAPFADDPYATANPYQNPNRYRFGL